MAPPGPRPEDIRQLLASLPNDGSEIVVRVDERGATTITVRGTDVTQVHSVKEGALEALDPARDGRLPGARLLGDPEELARRLGLGRGGLREQRLLRYRPHKRAVARVVTEPDGEVLYLKLLTKNGYRKAANVLQPLDPAAGSVQLMLPSRWLDKARIMVTKEAGGTALQDLIVAGRAIDLEQLAEAIRSFASSGSPAAPPLRSLEDERKAALTAIGRGLRVLPEIGELAGSVRDLALPGSVDGSLLHADLHAKQIFIDGPKIRLIDLEGLSRGDWRLDVVYLVEHLRLRALQLDGADRLEGYARDLQDVFGLSPDDDFARAASGLIKARFAGIYALRPRRIEMTRKLIDVARATLDSLD